MGIEDILKAVPVADIAKQFGVSPDVATQAITEGGAVLLGQLASNAQDEKQSAAIEKALGKHKDFTAANSVKDIDTEDGEKIVKHVFGTKGGKVAEDLNKSEKTAGGIDFAKLLPILAPIVLGLLAKGMSNKKAEPEPQESSGGGLGDVIGGLLGGGNSSGGGGGLGDVIGGLLGGGNSNSGGGGIDLGGLLGGILGGGKN